MEEESQAQPGSSMQPHLLLGARQRHIAILQRIGTLRSPWHRSSRTVTTRPKQLAKNLVEKRRSVNRSYSAKHMHQTLTQARNLTSTSSRGLLGKWDAVFAMLDFLISSFLSYLGSNRQKDGSCIQVLSLCKFLKKDVSTCLLLYREGVLTRCGESNPGLLGAVTHEHRESEKS